MAGLGDGEGGSAQSVTGGQNMGNHQTGQNCFCPTEMMGDEQGTV